MHTFFRAAAQFVLTGMFVASSCALASANDAVKVAVGQKGAWDTMVTQQGVEEGFFKKEGLDVEMTFTAGGSETVQAVSTGSVDVGIGIGTTAAIGAFAKGAAIRIIDAEMTGASDLYWFVRSESPIGSMKDMNGKTMSFSRPGSSSYIAARLLASGAGVVPTFVSSGETAATRTQVMSGQLDAGWSVPPSVFDLVAQKKVKIIARASDVPALRTQTVRVNIASAKFLSERRDVARRFVKVYVKTVDWMYAHRREAVARYARVNDISPQIADTALQFYPKAALATQSVVQFNKSLDDALAYKNIDKPLDSEQKKTLFDVVYTGK